MNNSPKTSPIRTTLAALAVAAMGLSFGTAVNAGETTDLNSWSKNAGHSISKAMYYPYAAYRLGREGAPTFHVTVNREGDITNSELTVKNGGRVIATAAKRALKKVDFPDLPSGYDGEELTFALTMNYAIAYSETGAKRLESRGTVTSKQVAQNGSATGVALRILNQAD